MEEWNWQVEGEKASRGRWCGKVLTPVADLVCVGDLRLEGLEFVLITAVKIKVDF